MSEWKPGDVAIGTVRSRPNVRVVAGWSRFAPQLRWCELSPRWADGDDDGCWFMPSQVTDLRRLVVIDPESDEDIERLLSTYHAQYPMQWDDDNKAHATNMQAALREMANPTPPIYTTDNSGVAPWPVVSECQSSHREDHECPQCAWEHEHVWVAWAKSDLQPGIPIRCTKCGGRKCDSDDCGLQRHHHTHEVTP